MKQWFRRLTTTSIPWYHHFKCSFADIQAAATTSLQNCSIGGPAHKSILLTFSKLVFLGQCKGGAFNVKVEPKWWGYKNMHPNNLVFAISECKIHSSCPNSELHRLWTEAIVTRGHYPWYLRGTLVNAGVTLSAHAGVCVCVCVLVFVDVCLQTASGAECRGPSATDAARRGQGGHPGHALRARWIGHAHLHRVSDDLDQWELHGDGHPAADGHWGSRA